MHSQIDIPGGGERKRPKDELPGVSCQPWRRPRPHAWPWCPPTCPARRPIRTKLSGKSDKQKSWEEPTHHLLRLICLRIQCYIPVLIWGVCILYIYTMYTIYVYVFVYVYVYVFLYSWSYDPIKKFQRTKCYFLAGERWEGVTIFWNWNSIQLHRKWTRAKILSNNSFF